MLLLKLWYTHTTLCAVRKQTGLYLQTNKRTARHKGQRLGVVSTPYIYLYPKATAQSKNGVEPRFCSKGIENSVLYSTDSLPPVYSGGTLTPNKQTNGGSGERHQPT